MVSSVSVAFMYVSVFLAVALPLILMIYFWVKTRYDLIAVAFGGLAYYFSQVIIKMGILSSIARSDWFMAMTKYPVLIGIFLAILAGILAEFIRILIFIFLIKKEERNWKNGLALGLGFGGTESIMVVGMAFISFIGYSIAINSGFFDTQIGIRFTAEEALGIKADLLKPSYIYLLAGLERAAYLVIQMALSILIVAGVAEGKPIYFGYAILAHVAINVPLILLGQLHRIVAIIWLFAVAVYAYKFITKAKNEWFKEPEGPIPL